VKRGIPGSPWFDPGGEALVLFELLFLILNLFGNASSCETQCDVGLVYARSALESCLDSMRCSEMHIGNRVKSSAFGHRSSCDLSDSIFSLSMRVPAPPVMGKDWTWSLKRSLFSCIFCERMSCRSNLRRVNGCLNCLWRQIVLLQCTGKWLNRSFSAYERCPPFKLFKTE
jgi:hypothetical protein